MQDRGTVSGSYWHGNSFHHCEPAVLPPCTYRPFAVFLPTGERLHNDRHAQTKILNRFNNPTVHSILIRVFTVLWAIPQWPLAEYNERQLYTTRWTHGEVFGVKLWSNNCHWSHCLINKFGIFLPVTFYFTMLYIFLIKVDYMNFPRYWCSDCIFQLVCDYFKHFNVVLSFLMRGYWWVHKD